MLKVKPFFVSIPHSGEKVPDFCHWLQGLPETLLMQDVDRYVDQLYEPILTSLKIPFVKTDWHRYAVDLNRVPEDVDASSVKNNPNPSGTYSRGFHWVITTKKEVLISQPMSEEDHKKLIQLIYNPFHESLRNLYDNFKKNGFKEVFHLDLHSMPSLGTSEHRDPGEYRADIVISDCKGKSCKNEFIDLVLAAYAKAGFKVAYNWPYFGGRITEQYGNPLNGQHVVQVELNRSLYMDESTKKIKKEAAEDVSKKLQAALSYIYQSV